MVRKKVPRQNLPVRRERHVRSRATQVWKRQIGKITLDRLPHRAHTGGAVESRTVKRIPDQFIGADLVIVKGLPWNYSAFGVLMKKTGPRKIELDKAEEQIEEKKAKEASAEREAREAGVAVALGLATPGLFGGGQTPAKTGLVTPRFAEKRKAEEPDEEGDPTATSSSSARAPAEAATAAA